MTSPLRRRVEHLERKGGSREAVFHVVGTNAEAREIVAACEGAKVRPPLIIVTGVERPPEQVSWDRTLARIATSGRRITDPPLTLSEPGSRVNRP